MANKDKPKIALISPQVITAKYQIRKAQPPLGISYLAAVLEEHGYLDILLIDAVIEDYDNVTPLEDNPAFIKFGASDDKIINKIKDFSPDLVGISALFSPQIEGAFSLAKNIKKLFPDLPIVLGGIHASVMYKNIMEQADFIDFILAGESDYTFTEFVEKYFNGADYYQIPGLIWREKEKIRLNPKQRFINDMDKLPFPAWHLFDMEKYFKVSMPHNPFVKSGRVGCVSTSRGCPQSCYFCSSSDYFGHAFRAMSANRVSEMVHYLVDKFAIKELQIMDDTFTSNYKRVIDVCDKIKDLRLRITLPNAIRADLPKSHEKRLHMFKAMQSAGVEQVGISVEHGDQEFIDKIIGKRLDLDEANVTCDLAHKADLLVHANFMMGFPFETKENRQRTIDFARKLDADSFSISLTAPLPGTRLWDVVKKNNLFAESFNVNRMVYTYVNIIPHDISPSDLYKLVNDLNCELNEKAQSKRPKSVEKYKLFKGKKSEGDRKYYNTVSEK